MFEVRLYKGRTSIDVVSCLYFKNSDCLSHMYILNDIFCCLYITLNILFEKIMFKPVVNAANPHSTVLGGTATLFIERSIYNHRMISNSFDVRNMMFYKIVFPTKKT